MSDTARMYRLLLDAGPRGVHTFDLRRQGISGNPSQRATDIEERYGVKVDREWEKRGDRRGKRFTLNVGVGAGRTSGHGERVATAPSRAGNPSTDSGVERSASHIPPRPGASSAPPESLFDLPPAPSAFDPWERAA